MHYISSGVIRVVYGSSAILALVFVDGIAFIVCVQEVSGRAFGASIIVFAQTIFRDWNQVTCLANVKHIPLQTFRAIGGISVSVAARDEVGLKTEVAVAEREIKVVAHGACLGCGSRISLAASYVSVLCAGRLVVIQIELVRANFAGALVGVDLAIKNISGDARIEGGVKIGLISTFRTCKGRVAN